jgi:hypothetical protein
MPTATIEVITNVVTTGPQGPRGPAGPQGPPGPPGPAASNGVLSAQYSAKVTTTEAEYPGDGKVVWNTAAQGDATEIYISQKTSGNTDISHALAAVQAGQQLTIQRKTDAEIIARYTVNAVSDHGTWFTFSVLPGSNSGLPFGGGDALIIALSAQPIA